MQRRIGVLSVITLAALAVACSKSDNTAGSDTGAAAASGMAATAASPAAANSTATAGSTTAATSSAQGGLTDANIAWILDQANAADSARGQLAETKGTNPEVKSFGKLMVGEHHALRAEGQALVKKLGVTPTAPAGDSSEAQAKAEMDSLTSMPKGAAWDKAYIGYEVGYHQAVINTATKALGVAQNDSLKALIKKAAPVIQHHLARAQAIQKKLGA
jgi:putative membrane protein